MYMYMWTARLKFRAAVNFNHQVHVHFLEFISLIMIYHVASISLAKKN